MLFRRALPAARQNSAHPVPIYETGYKKIEAEGAVLVRHGGKHDWYQNPATKVCQPVPRETDASN